MADSKGENRVSVSSPDECTVLTPHLQGSGLWAVYVLASAVEHAMSLNILVLISMTALSALCQKKSLHLPLWRTESQTSLPTPHLQGCRRPLKPTRPSGNRCTQSPRASSCAAVCMAGCCRPWPRSMGSVLPFRKNWLHAGPLSDSPKSPHHCYCALNRPD